MPRLPPDQFSLLDPTFTRIRLTLNWEQCDEETKGSRLKDAFREDSSPTTRAAYTKREDSWWRTANTPY